MTWVVRREGESIDQLVKRWRKLVDAGGELRLAKRRTRFISKSEQRRLKRAKAEHQRHSQRQRLEADR